MRKLKKMMQALIGTIALSMAVSCLPPFCRADVVTDGSLGPQSELAGPDFAITPDLGQIHGSNLFHSFSEFDLDADQSATFSGPGTIENIIGRITGGDPSQIDGTIRSSIEGANLFLLNPYGIMFGPNAALDITGSFYASTADYLRFDDGNIFFADPGRPSVLSVTPPEAFGFLSANPADITVTGSRLEIADGETFALIGGDIDISGASADQRAAIEAVDGRIALIGVGAAGEIDLADPQVLHDEGSDSGNIHLSHAEVSMEVDTGGEIVIRGGRLQIENSGGIASENRGSNDATAPGIDIEIAEDIHITDTAIRTSASGYGNSGNIDIVADTILLDGSESAMAAISTASGDYGNAGNIRIAAKEVTLKDYAIINSSTNGAGRGGDITITAADFTMAGLSEERLTVVTTSSSGAGNAGDISIQVSGTLALRRHSGISASAHETSTGNGGEIRLEAESIIIQNQSMVFAATYGPGHAGTIFIKADTLALHDNGAIFTNTNAAGDAGDIFIDVADTLALHDNGHIHANSLELAAGNAGDIHLSAASIVIADYASIMSLSMGSGEGGDILIETDHLYLTASLNQKEPTSISASSLGEGNSGDIVINAADTITLSGDVSISTSSSGSAAGAAGDITLSASNILLSNSAFINSATTCSGRAGNIFIAADSMEINSDSTIASISEGAGDGGTIEINCREDLRLNDGLITTGTVGAGDGGNIYIRTGGLYLSNDASISAKSLEAADAGDISIVATDNIDIRAARITTESGGGDGGNIQIHSGKLISLVDGEITAGVGGGESTSGGNIDLEAPYIILSDSRLAADAIEGSGGNIDIVSELFLADPLSTVDASSQLGIDGRVEIRSPETNLNDILKPLSTEVMDATDLLKAPCEARVAGGDYGSFVVKGRDALPPEPGALQISPPL